MKNLFVILTGLVSLVYLINPTAGLFEIIPDNFPIIGNLDEAVACALLLAVFRYFGIDLTGFLRFLIKQENTKKKGMTSARNSYGVIWRSGGGELDLRLYDPLPPPRRLRPALAGGCRSETTRSSPLGM